MLARFIDDDIGYLQWLRDRPGTFVLEAERHPQRTFIVVHRAECPTISGPTRTGGWTTRMIKVCATTLEEITSWCQDQVSGQPNHCQKCKPASTAPRGAAAAAAPPTAPADDPRDVEEAPTKATSAARRAPRASKSNGPAAVPAPAPARTKGSRQRSR